MTSLSKCAGTEASLCKTCARRILPSSSRQSWIMPLERAGECESYVEYWKSREDLRPNNKEKP